jgi:hypothetical protein
MPRGSRSASKKTVLGIVGVAEVSDADIKAQLEDLGTENVGSVVVLLTDPLPESLLSVLDWADDNKIPYDVVSDEINDSRDARGVQRSAREVFTAAKTPVESFVKSLTEDLPDGHQARIWALWDAELAEDENANDGHAYEILEAAEAAGIGCFDLAKGLEPLTFTDPAADDTAAAPEPEPEAEPEPAATPRARRSRAKTADEAQASEPVEASDAATDTAEVISLVAGPSFGGFDAVFNVFADVVAMKVVAILQAQAEEQKPARRSRSKAS